MGREVLFDTGSDPEEFMENLKRVVKPSEIKDVVISHPHWDHTGGLFSLVKENPQVKIYVGEGFSRKFEEELRRKGAEVLRGSTWRRIKEGIWVGPELPHPVPEQFLVVEGENRVLLIAGCSHPGIEKFAHITAEKFRKPMVAMGGFHLFSSSEEKIRETAESLKSSGVVLAYPSHCSGNIAERIFQEYFPVKAAGSGLEIEF